MIKQLLEMIPQHKIYVEVFGGSAELLFHKKPSEVEVYNDIDGDLVNLFEVVRNNFEEFREKAKWLLYSRELLQKFLREQTNDKIERAVRTWYIYQTSFSGRKGTWSYARQRKTPLPQTFSRKIEKTLPAIHERLKNVYIDRLDFRKCIKNWDSPKTFFFMDPPYYRTGQANELNFTEKDFKDLAEICGKMEGKYLITLNDEPFIRETFQQFNIASISIPWSSRPLTRISKLNKKGTFTHLIIKNY